jgi:beta-alanine degradation protein BauB
VRIRPHDPPRLSEDEERALRNLTRAAFGQRRKQLQKILRDAYRLTLEQVSAICEELGIDPRARPEELAPERFVELSRALRPVSPQEDLDANRFNPCVGSVLVAESPRARVWHIWLKPGERLPFHRHVLDYFWTAVSRGRSRSYFGDGRVVEADYEVGDTAHMHFAEGEYMVHDLTNIGGTDLGFVTVEFIESANRPLPLAESVRPRPDDA